MKHRLFAAALGSLTLVPAVASAHIEITSHTTRFDSASLKTAPCGGEGDPGPAQVYEFTRGSTITITWDEFIDHPGHYRIAFDATGQDAFIDPTSADDSYASPTVLLDDITDTSDGRAYSQEVTLPDVVCDDCTLQLIQVMTDKPPFGDGNDVYHQCIDMKLVDGVPAGAGGTTGAGGSSGGGGTTATGGLSAAGGSAAEDGGDPDGGPSCAWRQGQASPPALALLLGVLCLGATWRRRSPQASKRSTHQ